MSASTVSKPVPVYGPAKTLQALRAVERLGGSAGYLKYISGQDKPKTVPELPVRDDATVGTATIDFTGAYLYSWADISTSSGHSTKLEAWGFGVIRADVAGKLTLNTTWDDMLNGSMDFACIAGGAMFGEVSITFTRNGSTLAQIVSLGPVTGLDKFSGTCTWR
ncbi:hypothetical protein FRC09_018847 [Ceratobasidium sp. 395]|nr:hypothetical protein FRC09_018847 [Ceratobasidium sp. 395]